MEWLSALRAAIDYMEKHLTDDISAQDVGEQVFLSPFFLQRGFTLMTGCGIGEYLRNRRLYQAALDLQRTDEKVIDIALRYGYETPESFTKAFSRFHGATPSQVRDGAAIRRRRECTVCGARFTTHEEIDRDEVTVVKQDGTREPFSRQKLEK